MIAVLAAAILLTSSLTVFYYSQYENQTSESQRYVDELSSALASYRSLSTNYGAALVDYNRTISLLSEVVANMDTSTPSYQQASTALATLWGRYLALSGITSSFHLYSVCMLVDFGNGSRRWFNDTAVQPGWNAYIATVVLLGGNIRSTWYPQFQEHLVEGLDGVASGRSSSWFVWEYRQDGWRISQTGADGVPAYNGTVFAWTLCGYDSNFNPTCSP